MRAILVLTGLLSLCLTGIAATAAPAPATRPEAVSGGASRRESARLRRLLDEYWSWHLADNPGLATHLGDRRYDDELFDISEWAYQRRFTAARKFLRRADALHEEKLSRADRLTLRILSDHLRLALRGEAFHTWLEDDYLLPMNQLEGIHQRILTLPSSHPFKTARDFENYVRRLQLVPSRIDAAIANMRKGMALGVVLPRVVVDRIVPQLEAGISGDPKENALFAPITHFPESVARAERIRIAAAVEREIVTSVAPAFARLQRFLKDEYRPEARESFGLEALPRGRERLAHAIEVRTSTRLGAVEIHELGLVELERVAAEREMVVKELGFEGTPVAFNQKVQADTTLRWFDVAPVEPYLRENLDLIEARLPRAFANVPRFDYELKPVESFRAASFPQGAIIPASEDGSRPATFYYNTHDVATEGLRKFMLPNLAFHEVVPGHQLQFTYARRNEQLHPFRRYGGNAAYNEGWATYAERVADELGAYPDPYARNFYLSSQVVAFTTLVAETGIHAKGWTREEALTFIRRYVPMPDARFEVSLTRWATMPGQSMGYSLGSLMIRRARERAERALGERFDVRAFHDVVLTNGNVPLDVLDALVDEWIATEQTAVRATE